MSKIEIKTNVITNVLTWATIGILGLSLVYIKEEVAIYSEMKKALPQLEELNKTKEEMSLAYDTDIKKIRSRLWALEEKYKAKASTSEEFNELKKKVSILEAESAKNTEVIIWSENWLKHIINKDYRND